MLEYEAVCSRSAHRTAAGLTQKEVGIFLDAIAALVEPVETHYLWRPQLRDPGDEMVLEAAVNGQAHGYGEPMPRSVAASVTAAWTSFVKRSPSPDERSS